MQNLFNGIKPPGYVGNMRNSESCAGSGRKWEHLARVTDSSPMDVIGKIFLETTSMCLIKTLLYRVVAEALSSVISAWLK